MKPVTLLLLTSSLMFAAPQAFAQQDACQNRYGACMDHCSGRPGSLQESCASSCESQSNQCYVGMYGPSTPAMGQSEAAAPAAPAHDAEARDAHDEAKTPAKTPDKAPAQSAKKAH
jgi:hypothetical protein